MKLTLSHIIYANDNVETPYRECRSYEKCDAWANTWLKLTTKLSLVKT